MEQKDSGKEALFNGLLNVARGRTDTVYSVFQNYLESKKIGIGKLKFNDPTAHKLLPAQIMTDLLVAFAKQTNRDMFLLYALIAIHYFLEYAKLVVSSEGFSRATLKKAFKITEKASINTEGDLVPELISCVIKIVNSYYKSDKITIISSRDIHQRIDILLSQIMNIEAAIRSDHFKEFAKVQLQFAMRLVGYLMEKGLRKANHPEKIEHAKKLIGMLTLPEKLNNPNVEFYSGLFKEINHGITLSRKFGKQEASLTYENILSEFRDNLLEIVVIHNGAGLNEYEKDEERIEGEVRKVIKGFTSTVKIGLIKEFIHNGDPSLKTIPIINSIAELKTASAEMINLKMSYIEAVFQDITKNKQLTSVRKRVFLHAEQLASTITILLRYGDQPNVRRHLQKLRDYGWELRTHVIAYSKEKYNIERERVSATKLVAEELLDAADNILNAQLETIENPTVVGKNAEKLSNQLKSTTLIGHEYQSVYQLSYLLWRIKNNPQAKDLQNIARYRRFMGYVIGNEVASPLKEIVAELKQRYTGDLTKEADAREFADMLIKDPRIACQLPDEWIDAGCVMENEYTMNNAFPKSASNLNRAASWTDTTQGYNANKDGKYISACGPNRIREGGGHLDSFARLLLEQKPWCILALGDADDYRNYWQKNYEDKNYKITTFNDSNIGCRLVIFDINTRESHILSVVNIEVGDCRTLRFNYEMAELFLRMWEYTDADNPLLIHCASGVGRTGQAKWLLALLDEVKSNHLFAALVDKSLKQSLDDAERKEMVGIMQAVLCRFRKTRFSVQSEEQVEVIVPALLQLRAVQLNYGKEYFGQLTSAVMTDDKQESEITVGFSLTFIPSRVTANRKKAQDEPSAKLIGSSLSSALNPGSGRSSTDDNSLSATNEQQLET